MTSGSSNRPREEGCHGGGVYSFLPWLEALSRVCSTSFQTICRQVGMWWAAHPHPPSPYFGSCLFVFFRVGVGRWFAKETVASSLGEYSPRIAALLSPLGRLLLARDNHSLVQHIQRYHNSPTQRMRDRAVQKWICLALGLQLLILLHLAPSPGAVHQADCNCSFREAKRTQTQTFWSGYFRVGWGSSM